MACGVTQNTDCLMVREGRDGCVFPGLANLGRD